MSGRAVKNVWLWNLLYLMAGTFGVTLAYAFVTRDLGVK